MAIMKRTVKLATVAAQKTIKNAVSADSKEMSGGSQIRRVKFEMMISDIYACLNEPVLTGCSAKAPWDESEEMVWLAVLYDYDKLNDYGKIIMDQVSQLDEEKFDDVDSRTDFIDCCDDMEYRMKAAKILIEDLRKDETKSRLFIFWALMILTVDGTNKEEYLSMICDFVKMLRISDKELQSIMQIIAAVYYKGPDEIEVPEDFMIFSDALSHCDYYIDEYVNDTFLWRKTNE